MRGRNYYRPWKIQRNEPLTQAICPNLTKLSAKTFFVSEKVLWIEKRLRSQGTVWRNGDYNDSLTDSFCCFCALFGELGASSGLTSEHRVMQMCIKTFFHVASSVSHSILPWLTEKLFWIFSEPSIPWDKICISSVLTEPFSICAKGWSSINFRFLIFK